MAASRTFGRRGLSNAGPAREAAASDPRLDVFRASLKGANAADGLGEDQAFAAWLRAQRPRRWRLIGVRLAFLAPGLVCFAVHAPWWASWAIEGAGLFANGWIKTERVRQAQEIARWSAESGDKS